MENNLKELHELRETTKKEVAQKMINLVKYIESNSVDSVLSTWYRPYSTANDGMSVEMLTILTTPTEEIQMFSMDLEDLRDDKLDKVIADIRNINERAVCEGCNGYGTSGYYLPTVEDCRDWIKRKINQIAELEKMEIEKLKDILNSL